MLIDLFEQAKKNRVPFVDLLERRAKAAHTLVAQKLKSNQTLRGSGQDWVRTTEQTAAPMMVIGNSGEVDTLRQFGEAFSDVVDPPYVDMIKSVLDLSTALQQQTTNKNRTNLTTVAINQSVERAFKTAKLERFESFLGEGWSAERLRAAILKRVLSGLGLLAGQDLAKDMTYHFEQAMQRAGKETHKRLFELSELLAANRSGLTFQYRVYQVGGETMANKIQALTSGSNNPLSDIVISRFDVAMRDDENNFALRYRAQRIIFDCLSENLERIINPASSDSIQERIEDTIRKTCNQWVDNQFGKDGKKLNAQLPMPLRVSWSADGPKDDPSMYGRARDGF